MQNSSLRHFKQTTEQGLREGVAALVVGSGDCPALESSCTSSVLSSRTDCLEQKRLEGAPEAKGLRMEAQVTLQRGSSSSWAGKWQGRGPFTSPPDPNPGSSREGSEHRESRKKI